ncbi:MAG: hypothetical protein HKM06_01905 [Spirochaetales bacterium]|nr:hypothetical protein [Spirochaetales bacterium]
MRNLFLFLRRIAGFLARFFGGFRLKRLDLQDLETEKYAQRILSDAVLLNDIPSPSDGETLRMAMISKRLNEFGVSNIFTDEWGNLVALFPAYGTRRDFVLVMAEVGDTDFGTLHNSVHLSKDKASGQGLGERSLGAATLLVFAEFVQATDFHLNKNLLLLFTISSSVDEREEAFKHFLNNWSDRISHAILVRGTELGKLETQHQGAYRLSLKVESEERKLLEPGSQPSAAVILGEIAAKIGRMSQEGSSTAVVNIAKLDAGSGFGHWASQGEMDIEIVAEDEKVLEVFRSEVMENIKEASEGLKIKIETLVRFKRSVGDPKLNEPLISILKGALNFVKVKAETGHVSDKISLLNDRGIPAVALGITKAVGAPQNEAILLEPIGAGFRQLLWVIEESSSIVEDERTEFYES